MPVTEKARAVPGAVMPVIPELPAELVGVATFFEQFRAALRYYPKTSVTLSIIDVALTGAVIETTEGFTFHVNLANNGALDMKQVVVKVLGSQYVKVASMSLFPPALPGAEALSLAMDVPAHESRKFGPFMGWAASPTDGTVREIVSATVWSWDANLEHLLKDHTGRSDAPKGSYSNIIYG
jgi:hypothetical protein